MVAAGLRTDLSCFIVGLYLIWAPKLLIADEVYFNDFESPARVAAGSRAGIIGGYLESTQGFAELGHIGNRFGANFFLSDYSHGKYHEQPTAVTLTVLNLPEHKFIDLGFLFARIDSWDTITQSSKIDYFTVRVDDQIIFNRSFSYLYPETESLLLDPGVLLVRGEHLAPAEPNSYRDAAYDMSLQSHFDRIPHTNDSVVIEWFADGDLWQGDSDESWAIDNVQVTLVPELSSEFMGYLAAFGAFLSRRKKKRSQNRRDRCVMEATLNVEYLETRIALAAHAWNATALFPAPSDGVARSIVAVDLNGDGLHDVVESNGWFSAALENGAFMHSHRLENIQGTIHGLADLDRDGDRDVLFSNFRGLQWLENPSADTEPISLQITDRIPNHVELQDLNSDGYTDIVVAGYGDSVRTFMAADDGPALASSASARIGNSSDIQWRDLDDDGLVDGIARIRSNRDEILFLRASSQTTWDDPIAIATPGYSTFELLGTDLLMSQYGDRGVISQQEPASWLIDPIHPNGLPQRISDHALTDARYADVDADGDLDLLALQYPRHGNAFATPNLVWSRNVEGNHGDARLIQTRVESFELIQTDGQPLRVAIARPDRTSVVEFQNNRFRETHRLTHYDTANALTSPWFVDLDGDEIDDMVAVWASGSIVTWQKGLGDGHYLSPSPVIRGLRYFEHQVSPFQDVDGDGDLDFISADGYWHENLWPHFLPHFGLEVNSIATTSRPMTWGDFNADGLIDFITRKELAINQGGGQFEPLEHNQMFRNITGHAGDLDNDGDLDVWTSGRERWYENQGLEFTIRESPHPIHDVIDLDSDGTNELLSRSHDMTLVFTSTTERTRSLPVTGQAVDWNQDGHIDFVTGDVCTNRGDDTFDCEKNVLPAGRKTFGDFDGNGTIDFFHYQQQSGLVVYQITEPLISADFDEDGIVGFADFLILGSEFGREGNEGEERKSDLTSDGIVNFSDFLLFAAHIADERRR